MLREARIPPLGWLTEVWISLPLARDRPAFGWVERFCEAHLLARQPVGNSPAETGGVYGWLCINRFER